MSFISGETYIAVEATEVNNGISLYDVDMSGDDGGGEGAEQGSYYLYWDYQIVNNVYQSGGYRNTDWYWSDSNNWLSHGGWSGFLSTSGLSSTYTNDLAGFKKYLADLQPDSLDGILGTWPDDGSKGRFIDMSPVPKSCIRHI
ncbi:hypothetical protein [Faecalicatena fissicatena]|uniref:Uncharacterized protein n=1 Tax=Faecalicatena fissicatena TaxID=290055 RepID=A0ABS2E6C2_9FIRM|nr:hypothetical protein [Faecalicatena fissicatena]MBM6737177.1 hypothetical protein [Faecalicatena fissicatena]